MKRDKKIIISILITILFFIININVKALESDFILTNRTYNSNLITINNSDDNIGYEVFFSIKKDGKYKKLFTVYLESNKTYKYSHSKLKFNTTYYYKMRTYIVDEIGNKVYNDFGNIKSFKTKTQAPVVKSSGVNSKSIKLSWNKVSSATSYIVYKCSNESNSSCKKYKEIKNNSVVISSLSLGKTYYYNVKSCKKINKKNYCSDYGINTIATVVPGKVKASYTVSNNKNLIVKFTKENKNITYRVGYRLKGEKNYVYFNEITSDMEAKQVINNISISKEYDVIIKSKYNSYNGLNTTKTIKIKPTAVTGIKYDTTGYNTIKLSWDDTNIENTSYMIYRSTSKNGKYKLIKTVKTNSYNDKGLSYNKKYYYKIKTKINGLTSNYSSVKTAVIKIKKLTLNASSIGTNSVYLNFNEIEKANGYEIYRSTNNKTFKKINVTTNKYYFDEDIEFNKKYYYKVRAIVFINKKRTYGSYSNVVNIKGKINDPYVLNIEETSNNKPIIGVLVNRNDFVSGVEIYRSNREDGDYEKIITLNYSPNYSYDYSSKMYSLYDYTLNSVDEKFYYKVKLFVKINNKIIYSNFSNVQSKYIEAQSGKVMQEDGTYAWKNATFKINEDIEPGLYKVIRLNNDFELTTSYSYLSFDDDPAYTNYSSIENDLSYIEIPSFINDGSVTSGTITINQGKLVKANYDDIPVSFKDSYNSGVYIIGKEIEPGYYKTSGYVVSYSSLRGNSGSSARMERLDGLQKGGYVYIDSKYKAIYTSDTLTKVEKLSEIPNVIRNDGLYLVGYEIKPGKYKLDARNARTCVVDIYEYNKDYTNYSQYGYNLRKYVSLYDPQEEVYIELTNDDYFIEQNNCILTKVEN